MCGICGVVNFNNRSVDEPTIRQMMKKMKHRGPDDEGAYIDGNIGLGFVRLSILDLSSAGHQPMFSECGKFCIIYNGEVYNYKDIRLDLEKHYSFKSKTDTEVVLYSYIHWGEACLEKFNGMFAFTIYDIEKGELFCARDRFGIKPFYYINTASSFAFASDFQPLLHIMEQKPTPDDGVISNYLILKRTNYSEDTFFKEVKRLLPGHYVKVKGNKTTICKWYELNNSNAIGFNVPEEYYEKINTSIQLQLQSDVPVGISLSGGLDSSAIASVISADFPDYKLHSFSAIYNNCDIGDEQYYISEFEKTNLEMHYSTPTGESLFQDLDDLVETQMEPIASSSEYAEYQVMKSAKKYVTVILSGQGADEVLGGYTYFYGAYLKELLVNFKILRFILTLPALMKVGMLKTALRDLLYFLLPSQIKILISLKRARIVDVNFFRKNKYNVLSLTKKFYEFSSFKDFCLKHFIYKFEHHLMMSDKSGMRFSIETRFPFLDHQLIEQTLATKTESILYEGWTKYILRQAFINKMPEKIRLRRSKIGFETPLGRWFCEPNFIKFINEIVSSKSFENRGYIDITKFKKLCSDHFSGLNDSSQIIWKVINLELWLRKFIDNEQHN